MKTVIPEGYKSILSIYDTQKAISLLKRLFEDRLGALLNLYRVSAPLFVEESSGLNDNLNGVERPVGFDILRPPTSTPRSCSRSQSGSVSRSSATASTPARDCTPT